ncbi:MAG TPA: 2-dehydropantoate 2-reductase [Steroidobacteraceae bacterium]|nr:2-dehydropantoate 2-reductase [Steroidobacteraceae bacterium]
MTRAEFAILGAGAIGSILAAHLARAGHSVVVLARGERARVVERDGLRIKGLSDFSAPVPVIADPGRLQAADVLIVATKTPGTAAALERLRHVRVGVALSIQNGVLKDELLAQAFGAARVLGALADTSGELLPSGEVLFTRNVSLPLGELSGGSSERAQRLAAMIDGAGVRSIAVANILSMEWSKFTVWLGLVCMAVTTRGPSWRYLSDADSAHVLVRLVREVAQVAQAKGIALVDNAASLPLGTLIHSSERDAVDAILKVGENMRARAPDHRMSALQDLEAGRPLEIEETFGYATQQAKELHLPLPLLDAFYHLVAGIDHAGRGARGE